MPAVFLAKRDDDNDFSVRLRQLLERARQQQRLRKPVSFMPDPKKIMDDSQPSTETQSAEKPEQTPAEKKQEFLAGFSKFAIDLTAQAKEGKLPTAYGRDVQVEELLRALASPGDLFPVLIGGPRGGKTSIAHHAVNRMVRGECPPVLQDAHVFEVTPARMIAGLGGMNNWLGKMGDVFNALLEFGITLFIRDFHTGYGLGQRSGDEGSDFIEVVADLMQGQHPRVFFEARSRLLDLLNSERGNLTEMLAHIQVSAMKKDDVLSALKCAAEDLEVVHVLKIAPDACEEALELANRFQVNQLLPGSALDMLKDALTTADTNTAITALTVRKRFTNRSGLPEFLVSDDAPYDENETRRMLSQRVFGQEAAVESVLRTVALVRARLNNPIKPMGVFLFLGPTGVGKTELVKALSQIVFGGQEKETSPSTDTRKTERIVRFNMADYSNPYSAYERLFGDPFGRTDILRQGELFRRLSSQPFSVLLLDEFEKAAPNVYQSFLQLFDEGILVNAVSEELNLRNSIIVLTSNLGAQNLTHQIGFRVRDPIEQAEELILKQSEEYFRPEFINRLDAVCFFKPLNRIVIRQIAQREVQEIIARDGIQRQQLRIGVDDSVIDLIVERGFDLRFGARYLKRQIERSITYPLARQIARKRLQPGALVRLVARSGDVVVGLIEDGEETGDKRPEAIDAMVAVAGLQSLKTAKELRDQLDAFEERVTRMFEQHNIGELKERVSGMMDRIGDPDFWREPQEATAQIEKMNALSQRVDQAENVRRLWEKCDKALSYMLTSSRRGAVQKAQLVEVNQTHRELAKELPLVETMLLLRDEQDQAGAFVVLRVVDGDVTEQSVEWMRDLAKMYGSWAKQRGFGVSVLNDSNLDVTLNISGFGVYALLKGETGLHRLVRPLPKKSTEKTSVFARVEVMPDLPVSGTSLREMRFESRGVRENGAMVDKLLRQCSLILGKDTRPIVWLNALAAEEWEQQARRFMFARVQAQARVPSTPSNPNEKDDDGLVAIADQVRVYTTFKQQQVRDLRTKRSSTQVKKVLGGMLDDFLLAYLEMQG